MSKYLSVKYLPISKKTGTLGKPFKTLIFEDPFEEVSEGV